MKTIKSKQEFESVFITGKRVTNSLVRVTFVKEDKDIPTKVAFVAAKRLGNAVFRIRWKRVLREAARRNILPRDGLSLIFFATPKTAYATCDEIDAAFTSIYKKLIIHA